jgi:hypothetical protein
VRTMSTVLELGRSHAVRLRGFPRIVDAITIVRPETIACDGIEWASRPTGDGSPVLSVADRRSIKRCATFGVRPTSTVSSSSSALMLPGRRSRVHRRICPQQ